jgi:hypothetical protein
MRGAKPDQCCCNVISFGDYLKKTNNDVINCFNYRQLVNARVSLEHCYLRALPFELWKAGFSLEECGLPFSSVSSAPASASLFVNSGALDGIL